MITGPENTLEGLQIARDHGADGVEVDIRLTRDKEIVVFHDRDTIRLTGVSSIVPESTYKELRELKVLGRYKIPHLKEFLEFATHWPQVELYCDFHNSSFDLAETLARYIAEAGLEDRVFPLSFDYNDKYLLHARSVNPKIKLAIMPRFPWKFVSYPKALGAVKVCIGWDREYYNKIIFRLASTIVNLKSKVRKAQQEGMEVSGGVANTRAEALWFLKNGCEGLWTDDFKLGRRVIDEFQKI